MGNDVPKRIELYPCIGYTSKDGSVGEESGHVYKVFEIRGARMIPIDFMTKAEAEQAYPGLEVKIGKPYISCPDCLINSGKVTDYTREELLRELL